MTSIGSPAGRPRRRTWVVLGEMLEMGPDSAALHAEVGRCAAEHGVDQILAVGAGAAPVAEGATSAGTDTCARTAPDSDAAYPCFATNVAPATSCCSSPAATPGYGFSGTG